MLFFADTIRRSTCSTSGLMLAWLRKKVIWSSVSIHQLIAVDQRVEFLYQKLGCFLWFDGNAVVVIRSGTFGWLYSIG
jgi:hypothetical protein